MSGLCWWRQGGDVGSAVVFEHGVFCVFMPVEARGGGTHFLGAGTPVAYGPAAIYQEDPCQRSDFSVLSLVKGRAIQGLLADGGLVLRP